MVNEYICSQLLIISYSISKLHATIATTNKRMLWQDRHSSFFITVGHFLQYVPLMSWFSLSEYNAKQKHLGCKKMRGQEEPATESSDIN